MLPVSASGVLFFLLVHARNVFTSHSYHDFSLANHVMIIALSSIAMSPFQQHRGGHAITTCYTANEYDTPLLVFIFAFFLDELLA